MSHHPVGCGPRLLLRSELKYISYMKDVLQKVFTSGIVFGNHCYMTRPTVTVTMVLPKRRGFVR